MSPALAELEPEVAVDDPPEEALTDATEDPTAKYRHMFGERYERLPKQIVNCLVELTKEFGRQDRYLRRNEVNRDRKLRFYEKGVQHIFETNSGGWVQGTSGALITCTNGQLQMGEFCDDYDIFGPYSRIQQSVLTQTMPGVSFRPAGDDATRSEATDSAKAAEGYWEVFQRNNDMRRIATQMVRMFQCSARSVTWTRTEANAERFGFNADGTPKRVEVADVYGTLEHKCPILAKDLGDCLYNIIYRDPDVRLAKSWYDGENWEGKKFSELISANEKGIGEDAYERMARIGVLQGARNVTAIGESLDHIATDAQVWLRPASFTKDTGDALEEPLDDAKTLADAIKLLYPSGAQVAFVGEVYCGSWNCSTDDALDIQLPYEGDGMFGRAIMDPAVIPQDNVNDNMNAFRECGNYGWPRTWINAEQQAFDAITKQISAPYMHSQLELKAGEKIQDHIMTDDPLVIPPTLWEATLFLQGEFMQFLLACPPSLWGGSQSDVETSSGQHLAASQAMGQMGLFFGRMQRAFARIAYQAALLASKNPDHSKVIVIPGANGPTSVHLERISKSNFMAYPDEDSQFPESTPQKRAALDGVLEEANLNPLVGQAILNEPRNWKVILEKKGFPELVIPQAEVADYCQFKIEQLVQQDPVRSQPTLDQAMAVHAAATLQTQPGQQPPPPFDPMQIPADQPSIMPGPLDYHQWERDYCQSWLSSKARRDEEAKGNLSGIQNVTLYAQAQNAMIPPPPMALPVPTSHATPPPKGGLPQPAAAPAAPVQPAL